MRRGALELEPRGAGALRPAVFHRDFHQAREELRRLLRQLHVRDEAGEDVERQDGAVCPPRGVGLRVLLCHRLQQRECILDALRDGIGKDMRGIESNCEQDSHEM